MNSCRRTGTPSLLITAALVLLAGRVEAQGTLGAALWDESISLDVQTIEQETGSFMGSDPNRPEPGNVALSGTGYEVTGSVAFGTEAPPVGTAQVTWNIGEAGAALSLFSSVSIDFSARVVETAPPPVGVTEVPVHLVANGSATVTEIFGSRATSFFRFQAIGTSVLIFENLDVYGDSESPSTATGFAIDETPSIPPGTIILVAMSATSSMGTVGTGGATTGSATGMVDPIIEVADEMIPGTTSSYRDFYAVEFSEGTDAQTPVERVTLGGLKQLFGTPR